MHPLRQNPARTAAVAAGLAAAAALALAATPPGRRRQHDHHDQRRRQRRATAKYNAALEGRRHQGRALRLGRQAERRQARRHR